MEGKETNIGGNITECNLYLVVFVDIIAKEKKLECGPTLNVMAALPNIGGALCSTPQSLADAHY